MTFPPRRRGAALALLAAAFATRTAAADPPAAAAATTNAPRPAAEVPARVTAPDGFKVTLFAGEPDVVQPIAFAFDDRGRLWVVECLAYPKWRTDGTGGDRVVILEDADRDGKFDKRTVFWDKGSNLSGIELGFGGVWLCSVPNLIFLPDRDRDDKPDGPPEVVLDGWDLRAQHNVFSNLVWGPDGRLYGCNGILSNSKVGPPGTPEAQRVSFNCGVWRYHPVRRTFEVVAWGATNPWGLDFDDDGEMFVTNCVTKHLYHVIPGGHYERMFGQDVVPDVYDLIPSIADHIHWAGGPWQASAGGGGAHDKPGGGHAHSGAMIYLGDAWPDRYRNSLFMLNIHGRRLNNDRLDRKGAGYVGRHEPDFLVFDDPWFRGIAVHAGPDGAAYVTDWSDTGECHNYTEVRADNGRIYKIAYGGGAPPVAADLAALDDLALVRLQLQRNDWNVRHARRLLQERAAAGKLGGGVRDELLKELRTNPDPRRKLRALWALNAIGGTDAPLLVELMSHPDETVRSWAVRLAAEEMIVPDNVRVRFAVLAREDPSPRVRLALASALRRLAVPDRTPIAMRLIAHAEDSDDDALPRMIWYGIETVAAVDAGAAAGLVDACRIPLVRRNLARRLAAIPAGLAALVRVLGWNDDPAARNDVLDGMLTAFEGLPSVPLPEGWPAVARKLERSADAGRKRKALALSALFAEPAALAALRSVLADPAAPAEERRDALRFLARTKDASLVPALQAMIGDPAMGGAALRGLAAFGDPATPGAVLARYAALGAAEKTDAVSLLASRPAWAQALAEAVEKGSVPRNDVTPFFLRQMRGLGDADLAARVDRVWGPPPAASKEREERLGRYRWMLAPELMTRVDASRGRRVFDRTCASCHVLFDAGGKIGPDLTGSQRANVEYILENVLDPSSVVADVYRVTVVQTEDGRTVSGIVKEETDTVLTLQSQNETVTIPKQEITGRKQSAQSLMPEGLLDQLTPDETRDLVAYLAAPAQVPPAPEAPK